MSERHVSGAAVPIKPLPFGLHGRTLKGVRRCAARIIRNHLHRHCRVHTVVAIADRTGGMGIRGVGRFAGLYAAEFLIAMPLHWMFERGNHRSALSYIGAGIVTSLIATWVWSEIVRFGPIPLFRDFAATTRLTVPAGAVGGALFWRIAVRPASERQWATTSE